MRNVFLMVALIGLLYGGEIEQGYYRSYDYERMGAYRDAIKVLIPLYRKYPKGYTLNLRLAWLFFLNKNYKNAIAHYKKASMILPASLEPKLGLTMVYLRSRNYQAAKRNALAILHTDYYNYYGNLYLARALLALKELKQSEEVVRKMLRLYPTDVRFLLLLARVVEHNDPKRAQKIYRDILILDPNNPFAKSKLP